MPAIARDYLEVAKELDRYRPAMLARQMVSGLADVSRDTRAEAALTRGGTLLITGSNGLGDYVDFNLRPGRRLAGSSRLAALTGPLPVTQFHGGFLLHALKVHAFLRGRRPSFIAGHSLGAASAQILGTALRVPAIGFASPQVIRDDQPQVAGEGWVMNVVWKQDFVTEGYKLRKLRWLGSVQELDSARSHFGIDHVVKDYISLLESDRRAAAPKLTAMWPRPRGATALA
ncbi:alpha/beta hydrolase family protein [Mangrovicoccus ximenensis]|uniref:hypothetical protein n=1 Tax=Mangrovicoccus ximenensis TaxID=1911570 RepID=UPI000D34A173|nr:hypothetical protein [Mangrovicoccus ximenensis]